jgi:hypothetical protein
MASATANGWQISPEEFPSADWAMMSTTTTGPIYWGTQDELPVDA